MMETDPNLEAPEHGLLLGALSRWLGDEAAAPIRA
jgi:hypothetical protein